MRPRSKSAGNRGDQITGLLRLRTPHHEGFVQTSFIVKEQVKATLQHRLLRCNTPPLVTRKDVKKARFGASFGAILLLVLFEKRAKRGGFSLKLRWKWSKMAIFKEITKALTTTRLG